MFDFTLILLLIINGLISVSLFVSALIYYLKEKHHFQENKKTSLFCSGLICIGGILNALMMRYVVQFPEVGGYNLNSNFYLITNLTSALLSFFTYYLYLRTGQGLALSSGLPGSILLSQGRVSKSISWKTVLLPIPLLIAWTFIWFAIASPEPTDLALASTPEGNSPMNYIYTFFTASILAPVTEEILYRHFVMGLLARWFGSSKAAVVLNIWVSSLVFAIAYAGVVTDDWIKIMQILPAGVVFGWINRKKGLEHSILAHSLFNTLIIPSTLLLEQSMTI